MVSAQMSRMPRSSTGLELSLRRALYASGLRFRVNFRELPGTPDIAFPKAQMAIFVDGCFWHGCSEHGVLPKSNSDWWRAKLEGNRERDKRKDAALAEMGWVVLHFWEHEAVSDMVSVVTQRWRERTGREPVVRSPSEQ
jgi:DNA mismatch endonuclease (patch repair protein)